MGDLHAPATDPNQAILERLKRLESLAQQWENGQVVCHPSEGRLRIVRGVVSTVGGTFSIIHGKGFTGARSGAGSGTITFTTPFSDPPTVVVTGMDVPGVQWTVTDIGTIGASGSTTTGFSFQILSQTFGAVDNQLHFIAVGPV